MSRATTDTMLPPRAPRRAHRGRLLIVAAVAALVLGPILVTGLPDEIARWYLAAGQEKRLEGDLAGAIAKLDKALEWSPKNVPVRIQRAAWRQEAGALEEALEDAERALLVEPESLQALMTHSQILQALGRYDEAVADWKTIRNLVEERRERGVNPLPDTSLLNGLAYARALAQTELDQALRDANEALRLTGWREALYAPEALARLAYSVKLRTDEQPAEALEQLDEAYELAGRQLTLAQRRYLALDQYGPGVGDMRRRARVLGRLVQQILYDRMRLNLELERDEAAEADRLALTDVGADLDEMTRSTMEPASAMVLLESMAAIVDTRGLIEFHRGNLRDARRDLDAAVRLTEQARQLDAWLDDHYRQQVDIRPLELRRETARKTAAVIYYHRMLVREAGGDTGGAEEDGRRVDELGYEPGEPLF